MWFDYWLSHKRMYTFRMFFFFLQFDIVRFDPYLQNDSIPQPDNAKQTRIHIMWDILHMKLKAAIERSKYLWEIHTQL